MIGTVEDGGMKRTWDPLSRTSSWRAGCFWEERQRAAKVFIQKDEQMFEIVVKKIECGRERFWFEEKKDQPQHPKEAEEPASGKEEVVVL